MSKIDSAEVHRSVSLDVDRARQHGRAEGKSLMRATEDQVKALIEQMLQKEQLAGSALLRLDLTASSTQLRAILCDELLKVLQQVPGFVMPQLSRPPTPDETKQLLKLMQSFEKEGLLQKHDAFAKARPEDARAGILQKGTDEAPTLKNWGQFVQSTTNAQSARDAQALSREGLQEGQAPHELHAQEIPRREAEIQRGAGLRTPALIGDGFAGLNNKQKLDIMTAGFGRELAMALKESGIRDPSQLLKAASTPEGREMLAKQLGLSRAQLVVHLARAEMLSIGPGRNGEQALRPQHLPALQSAQIVTQSQLASVHGMGSERFSEVFQNVRENFSGFARAMSGDRPVLKKDLQHWAKSAAKRKSSLLDAEWDELPRKNGDAEELIMGWYLEHWNEIEDKRREAAEQRELEKEAREALKRGDVDLPVPKSEYDPSRDDGLICFWIERPNLDFNRPTLTEMVYICLDPRTGMIDLKSKE